MGVSLIGPVVLLLAAVVVAAGGGGLGGLGSLGQISSGPTLPDIGPVPSPRASLEEAELATAGLTPSTPAAPFTSSQGANGRLAPSTGDEARAPGARPGGAIIPVTRPREPQRPGGGPRPVVAVPPASTPPASAPPASTPQRPSAPPADPVGDVIDTTRGLGDSLPTPLGPITSDILDSLLGPKR